MTTAARSYYSPDPAVIVASGNAAIRQRILQTFHSSRIQVAEACGGADAIGQLESSDCRLLLLDGKLPDLDSGDLMHIIHSRFPGIDVLMLDEAGQPLMPREWRSADARELFHTVSRWQLPQAADSARVDMLPGEMLPGIIGTSAAMHRVHRLARLVAAHDTPVLLTGPTGTGKELVANAVHELSSRAGKRMVTINCAAIPEALLEAELFGYTRGAFTGAVQSHMGRIHAAQGSTLFLDEIGEMPLGMQAKLLRFIDRGEIQRLGSADICRVDARVVAATNLDLAELSRQKLFREDLYYRLAVFPIELPPLAQRGGDVGSLAEHFVQKFAGNGSRISGEARYALEQHDWPGNVRELQHVIERALILAEGGPIQPEHLGLSCGVAAGSHFA
jgi:transcriptional regulator with GAF, ATPase, and Fis domain/CheY-like chemotaxis protein